MCQDHNAINAYQQCIRKQQTFFLLISHTILKLLKLIHHPLEKSLLHIFSTFSMRLYQFGLYFQKIKDSFTQKFFFPSPMSRMSEAFLLLLAEAN